MDTFDEYYVSEPAQEEAPHRPVSPFADSPYEMAFEVSQPVRKQKKTAKAGKGRRVLALICAAAVLLCCCAATAVLVGASYEKRMERMSLSLEQKMAELERQLQAAQKSAGQQILAAPGVSGMTPDQIYASAVDSVVSISAYGEKIDQYGVPSQIGGGGSGFLISEDGYVVTNCHVIQDMTEVYVILQDKTELEAAVVGYDAAVDVALLKIEGEGYPYLELGSSDAVVVGEQVVAIGYPLLSDSASMTVGYISAKDQIVDTDGTALNMLQTDTAINSGNSGGPLLNAAGQVVGITTAKFSGYSNSGVAIEGMSFAVPMDDAVRSLQDLKEYGYVTGAYLGVYVRDVSAEVQMYGLPAGAYVDDVMEGLAAQRGGIKAGDVITELGGYDVGSVSDLTRVLRRYEAGQKVTVTVWRNGRQTQLSVVLDEKPLEEMPQEENVQQMPVMPDEETFNDFEDWQEYITPFFGLIPGFGD